VVVASLGVADGEVDAAPQPATNTTESAVASLHVRPRVMANLLALTCRVCGVDRWNRHRAV
jgi:hypothetical protein